MEEKFNFEKLHIYHEAVQLVVKIYEITKGFPKDEVYGLTSQIRRAAVSIVSNICEGSNRSSNEFKRYIDISRGSLLECVGQLQISLELKYLIQKSHQLLYQECIKLSKMLMALKKAL